MTLQGAIAELRGLIKADDVPICYKGGISKVIETIQMDAVEVRHGKWIDTSSGDHWKCSRCNCRAGFWFNEENSCEWSMDMSEWLSDYCPNCGARMKGDEDE